MSEKEILYQGLGKYRLDGSPRAYPRNVSKLEQAGSALISKLVADGMDPYTARKVAEQQGLTSLENQPLLRPADLTPGAGSAIAFADYEQDPGLLTGVGAVAGMFGPLLGVPARLAKTGLRKAGEASRTLSRGVGSLMPDSSLTKALEDARTIEVKPNAETVPLSDEAREGVKQSREDRKQTSGARNEYPDEAFFSHSHGEAGELAEATTDGVEKRTKYKSKLRNALFNDSSLLMGGGDRIKPTTPINVNRVRNNLKRMGVSENEMQVSGITDLLNNNKAVTLEDLRKASDEFSPRLSVVRYAEAPRDMRYRTYQRFTHDPNSFERATDDYNVVDYEEVLINDNRSGISDMSVGSDHYDGSVINHVEEGITGQQGHYRGSVLTEFSDEELSEAFPDGAYLSEEIQTDFNFGLRDSAKEQDLAMRNYTRALNLGDQRLSALRENFDDDVLMNTVAEYLPVNFEKGASDFADSARRRLHTVQSPMFKTASDLDVSHQNILRLAVEYKSSPSSGTRSAKRMELQKELRSTAMGYDRAEVYNFIDQLDKAPAVPNNVSEFVGKLGELRDSVDDIAAAKQRSRESGFTYEMTPERRRVLDEGRNRRNIESRPFEDAVKVADSEFRAQADARRPLSEALRGAGEKEAKLYETARPIIEAAEAAGVEPNELGSTAVERLQNGAAVSTYRRFLKEIRGIEADWKKASEKLDAAEKRAADARSARREFLNQFDARNPELALLENKQSEAQFVFEDESDFVRFTVDTMIERARDRGLSGVIFPDWQDIRDIRMSPPNKDRLSEEGYAAAVKEYESASNKFRAMYNDTIKKRLNDHKGLNPGSKVHGELNVKSTNIALPSRRSASAKYFNKSDEERKAFGFSFGKAEKPSEIPPASFAKGGMVYKGIGSMGREVL